MRGSPVCCALSAVGFWMIEQLNSQLSESARQQAANVHLRDADLLRDPGLGYLTDETATSR
jgi:hypothetical protein